MIVEDEMLIAMDLEAQVMDAGFDVLGPFASVAEAMEGLAGDRPDAAILDVKLGAEEVFPVAERLREDGIPFLFHSAHAKPDELESRYPGALVCSKPCAPEKLIGDVEKMLGEPVAD